MPYNMGQKISHLTRFSDDTQAFLRLFLEDGTVQKVKFVNSPLFMDSVEEAVKIETVAKFPVAAKGVVSFFTSSSEDNP